MSNSKGGRIPLRAFAMAASALLVALGVAVLVGWARGSTALKQVGIEFASTKANTAGGMLLCGLALGLLAKRKLSSTVRRMIGILALLLTGLGALTLAEYAFGWNLGIDQVLLRGIAGGAPGADRMSPSTALCFLFVGVTVLCMCGGSGERWRRPMAGALATTILLFACVTASAYAGESLLQVHFWNYTGVAIPTSLGFLLMGGGLLAVLRSGGGAKWALDAITTTGLLAGVFSLIAVAMIANDFTYHLRSDDFWVSHTHEVIEVVETIDGGMTDLESGQRGFLITGEEGLLERRAATKEMVAQELAALRSLTSDNPSQQPRAERLGPLIAARTASGDRTIAAYRASGFAEAQRLIATNTGIVLSDQIRALLKEMRAEEYGLLETREARANATAIKTFLLLPLEVILSVGVLFVALFFMNAGAHDRAQVEQALRTSNEHLRTTEERFRLLIAGVRDYAIYLLDAEGNVATWNTGAQQLKQWTPEEIVGQHFSRFRLPEEQAEKRPQRALEIAVETGHYEEQGWRVRKDGSRFWAEARITAIRDDQGRPAGFAKVTRDLTEQRRIELALKEDEARLAAVIDSAMDAVITVDEEQKITLFNPAAEKMFGYRAEAVMGKPLEQLMPGRFRGSHRTHIRNFSETRTSRRTMGALTPIYGLRANGEEFPIEASISQAEVSGKKIFSVILRDISERVHAEEELRQQASLLDLAPVLVRDMQNRVVFWSSALEKLYSYSKEEAEGSVSHFLLHTEFPVPLEEIERGLREHGSWEGEVEQRSRDGAKVIVSSLWVLYRDAQGQPIRILEVNADVTERKRAETLQLRSQKLESLGTLSGGIAHDFNNILLAITGNAKLAIADLAPDNPVQESLQEIAKAGARATELVRRILTFSRPGEIKRQIIDLQPVVEEALKLVRATLPATIEFRTTFGENLPTVLADSTQVHQIIVNLATNAAHAIGSRSDGMIEVRLDAAKLTAEDSSPSMDLPEGKYVRLFVSDNGCGMDRATLERIYDPFFTTKKPGEGTGLGLSVVHGIMKNHAGAIVVYSEPGRGTAFRLFFPAAGADGAGVASTNGGKTAESTHRRTEAILYVDDEEPLVALVKRTLERLGYKVTGQNNPVEALELFRRDPTAFDAVVTDLAMPQLSGFDFAGQLLEIRADLPIVMTSGYVRPEDQERALHMGLRDLILKPDTIEQLARTLDQVFSHDSNSTERRSS